MTDTDTMENEPADAGALDTKGDEKASVGSRLRHEAAEWGKVLSVFVPLFFLFSGLFYEQRVIPSESMVPSLQVGDRVVTNKMAYGYSRYSIPWGLDRFLPLGEGRILASMPKRGDVIVFMHTHTRRVMIKRLIGLPGDTVQVRGELVYLNGEPLPTEFIRRLSYVPKRDWAGEFVQVTREYRETLGDKSYLRHEWRQGSDGDQTALFEVPEGHVFFMGDNRDNSVDSRIETGHCAPVGGVISTADCPLAYDPEDASIGFVPIDNLIGRAETVLWTVKRCRKTGPGGEPLDCPPPRVWRGL